MEINSEMRKRELQSIPLKLGELKEYDVVKAERTPIKSKNIDESNMKESSPIVNVTPKSKKDVQERINPTM
uniref:Uncharacterized protein n=1 Tax=Glossina austeni TaxID=7395 RepID=A0A1A9UHM9_GLOAU